jgi:CubicO group peptidase (beta-lactamase class C family)
MPLPIPFCSPEPAVLRDAGLDAQRARRITARMARLAEERQVNGMALRVQRRGQTLDWAVGTLHGTGKPAFGSDTLVRLFSVTKPMTSALMFTLFEEGHWRFDDPLTRYLPELADLRVAATGQRPVRDIVMRDLLLHQAGFAYGIGGADEVDRLYEAERVLDFGAPLETMLARLAKLPLAAEPGTSRYSIAHDLLGLVAQRITDRPLATLMRERLFTPLGMDDACFGVDVAQAQRLATLHQLDAEGCCVPVDLDAPGLTRWKLIPAPALHSGGAGVVATM